MAEEHEKSLGEVPEVEPEGSGEVMGENQESETGADPNSSSTAPLSDAARIQETFSRVMQKVKSAYHKELQRKKQVDLTSSVDIMRNRNMDETTEESNEDDEAMQAMTKEIEVTRRLLEVSQLREEQSKQTIAQLEAEVQKLQKLVEEEEALRRDEGLTLNQLVSIKRQLTLENEKLGGENQTYSQQFVLLQTELQEATSDKKRLDSRLIHLQQELLTLREELEAEIKASALARSQRDAVREEADLREIEITELRQELEKCQAQNIALASSQTDLEEQNQKLAQASSVLSTRFDHLVRELDSTKKMLTEMDDENAQLSDQLKATHNQIQERMKDINGLEAYQRMAIARIEFYEKECTKAEAERDLLETQLDKLDKELELVRFAATGDRQGSDKILRENRQLHVQLHGNLIAREKQGEVWEVQQETIRRLETTVRDDSTHVSRLRWKLNETERENSRLIAERESLRNALQKAVETASVKEKEFVRLTEDRLGLEKRIQQLQLIEETGKQTKSALDYDLAKIKEENYEKEKRLKTLMYMVEKLKEELTNKEAVLMQSKRVKLQLERDLTNLKKAVEDHKKTEIESRSHALQQEKQLQKLQLLLQQVKSEWRDATNNIQAEKNSSAVIEQNFTVQREQLEEAQELLNQQEKRIQELIGVTKRQETDISLLMAELARLDQEKKAFSQKIFQSSNLQRDYENLRETLLHEQSRRAALETLKSTPVLVHPWRILQAANPTAYVTMMREQAAKRNKLTTKGRTILPDVTPKRPISSFTRHGPNNELQIALIKAIV